MAVTSLFRRDGILLDVAVIDSLITGPTIEPLTLDEAKLQLRFTSTTEDDLIALYLVAARQHFESATGRQLLDATYERHLAGFPAGGIELPRPPLLEVVSVGYLDSDGADQMLTAGTDYVVEQPTGPFATRGVVRPIGAWPSGGELVRVKFRAGYGTTAEDVPPLARAALLLYIGHLHKFRAIVQETSGNSLLTVPLGYAEIVQAFKYTALGVHPPRRDASVML